MNKINARFSNHNQFDERFKILKNKLIIVFKAEGKIEDFVIEIIKLTEDGSLNNLNNLISEVFQNDNFNLINGNRFKITNNKGELTEKEIFRYFIMFSSLYDNSSNFKGFYLKLLTDLILTNKNIFLYREVYDYFVNDYQLNYRNNDSLLSINAANTVLNW